MEDIMYEKLNIGPTLKLNRQSLNKKFDTHISKSMISMMPWKDKQCITPINEFISGKSLWGVEKLVLSQNKSPYNLETFECNHKKLGTQSETSLLINSGKVFILSSKNGGVIGRKVAL